MPKATTVYGIVSYGGDLVRGMARIVLTTEEPITVLENDKLYYGENVRAKFTKTKTLTMHDLTEKLEEAFASHKTDVPHMYKLNSTESVKILKTVFDVKTCKKLSFSKDSDDDSEDNDSTVSTKEEEPKVKTAKEVKATGKTTKADEPEGKTKKADEPVGKTKKGDEPVVKTKKADEPVVKTKKADEPVVKTAKTDKPSGKSSKVEESKVVKDEVSASKKKPDLTDSKKTSTSKVKSSTVRIPLSDSDDDELQSEDDLDA